LRIRTTLYGQSASPVIIFFTIALALALQNAPKPFHARYSFVFPLKNSVYKKMKTEAAREILQKQQIDDEANVLGW